MMQSNFLIAAPSSGSGKTTATLGILRALHNRGLKVQAFKSGPDYIDPKFHELSSGLPSINLDMFFSDKAELKRLYQTYSNGNEVSVVEGVMGLFDGFDKQKGSSADLAKMLDIPVVLVVNGKSVAHSIAALLYGFKHFDASLNIAGVIFNQVSSATHYQIMKTAAKEVGLISFGHIPKNLAIEIPSRHLGLNIDEKYRFEAYADDLAAHIEKFVDIDLLIEATQGVRVNDLPIQIEQRQYQYKIGIAQDEAFNFMYPENVRKLEMLGQVVFFSPIKDKVLPEVDYLYLPGGYPEFFLQELSQNKSMLESVYTFVEKGGKVWAECGGMLYLCREFIDEQGVSYPLCNIFNLSASMQQKKLRLGYRYLQYQGMTLKGHEFHYSSLVPHSEPNIAQQFSAKHQAVDTALFRYKNAIAGYTHIYWKTANDFLKVFD